MEPILNNPPVAMDDAELGIAINTLLTDPAFITLFNDQRIEGKQLYRHIDEEKIPEHLQVLFKSICMAKGGHGLKVFIPAFKDMVGDESKDEQVRAFSKRFVSAMYYHYDSKKFRVLTDHVNYAFNKKKKRSDQEHTANKRPRQPDQNRTVVEDSDTRDIVDTVINHEWVRNILDTSGQNQAQYSYITTIPEDLKGLLTTIFNDPESTKSLARKFKEGPDDGMSKNKKCLLYRLLKLMYPNSPERSSIRQQLKAGFDPARYSDTRQLPRYFYTPEVEEIMRRKGVTRIAAYDETFALRRPAVAAEASRTGRSPVCIYTEKRIRANHPRVVAEAEASRKRIMEIYKSRPELRDVVPYQKRPTAPLEGAITENAPERLDSPQIVRKEGDMDGLLDHCSFNFSVYGVNEVYSPGQYSSDEDSNELPYKKSKISIPTPDCKYKKLELGRRSPSPDGDGFGLGFEIAGK